MTTVARVLQDIGCSTELEEQRLTGELMQFSSVPRMRIVFGTLASVRTTDNQSVAFYGDRLCLPLTIFIERRLIIAAPA